MGHDAVVDVEGMHARISLLITDFIGIKHPEPPEDATDKNLGHPTVGPMRAGRFRATVATRRAAT